MLIERAIKTAIEYEEKVRDVYQRAAKTSTDRVGRRVFQMLADDEANHVLFLQHQLGMWLSDKKITPEELKIAIPDPREMTATEHKLEAALAPSARREELALLEKAREVELETSSFYERMVKELPDEGKALFQRFLAVEENHLNVVQYEIDSLTGNGFWMGWQEFDMEAID